MMKSRLLPTQKRLRAVTCEQYRMQGAALHSDGQRLNLHVKRKTPTAALAQQGSDWPRKRGDILMSKLLQWEKKVNRLNGKVALAISDSRMPQEGSSRTHSLQDAPLYCHWPKCTAAGSLHVRQPKPRQQQLLRAVTILNGPNNANMN